MSVVLCVCLFCFETSMFVFLKLFNKTRQDNTIYKYSIKLFFSSIGQDKSKLQKQISELLILIATAA